MSSGRSLTVNRPADLRRHRIRSFDAWQPSEQDARHFFVAVQKVARDAELFRFSVEDGADAVLAEFVDRRAGEGEKDGGVRGDDQFSPTKNVTLGLSSSRSSARIAGRQNG